MESNDIHVFVIRGSVFEELTQKKKETGLLSQNSPKTKTTSANLLNILSSFYFRTTIQLGNARTLSLNLTK